MNKSNLPVPPWERRLDAVGSAQSRYLWLLLVAGVFYLSLGLATLPSDDAVATPILGLELSPTAVWASGPAVLSLLILVVIGSLRAVKVARDALGLDALGNDAEAFDVAPNAIDLAAYSTKETHPGVQWLLGLSYPSYLTFFLGQAAWQLVMLWSLAPARTWVIVVAVPSTVLVLWASARVLWFWLNRLPRAPKATKAK